MKRTLLTLALATLLNAQTPEQRKPDRVISIAAERFTFNPSKVTVKQGELIEFVLNLFTVKSSKTAQLHGQNRLTLDFRQLEFAHQVLQSFVVRLRGSNGGNYFVNVVESNL